MALLQQADDDSTDLIDACGEEPRRLCEWVFERTDNRTLSELTDWFVARPLTILLILAIAWLAARLARRGIRRLTYRLVAPDPRLAEAAMRKVSNARAQTAIDSLLRDPRRHARASAISAVMGSTVTVVVWVITLMMVLGELDVNLAPLLAGAGIAGVALGFGAQSIVQDTLSGLFILIEDQLGIGDVVDLGEATGVVEKVTLRITVIRGLDGTLWHVPNGQVQRVGNMSQLWSVALIDATVAYDSDIDRVRELMIEAANEVSRSEQHSSHVLDAPEVMGVEALGADGVTVRLMMKTAAGEQWAVQRALREAIKATFERNGIEIPFPQRTVWMRVRPDGS